MEKLEIFISPRKTIILILGSIGFVALGLFFLLNPEQFIGWRIQSEFWIQVVGAASMLFFGFALIIGIKNLFRREPGLVFDSNGIAINMGGGFKGLVEWRQISGFSEVTVQGQHLIMIHLENPEAFIQSQKSSFHRKIMQFSLTNYGSPISLTATGMQTSYPELLDAVEKYFGRYK